VGVTGRGAAAGSLGLIVFVLMLGAAIGAAVVLGRSGSFGRPGVAG
jgi:hypothetical protein